MALDAQSIGKLKIQFKFGLTYDDILGIDFCVCLVNILADICHYKLQAAGENFTIGYACRHHERPIEGPF